MTYSSDELQPRTGEPHPVETVVDDDAIARRAAAFLAIYVADPVHRASFSGRWTGSVPRPPDAGDCGSMRSV